MNQEAARLLAALPSDLVEPARARDELSELIESLAHRTPPEGRLHRAWILGSLHAKLAAGYGWTFAKGLFADEDEKRRLVAERHLRAALQIFGTMGYLRGAVMKAGQLVGSLPNVAPEAWFEMLEALQAEAPPMHFSLIREQVRRELGADPEELFASFDTNAVAAASLGQVHRATLKSGEPVAVKIQYPGIASTIRSDLANMRLLVAPLRFSREFENMIDVVTDIEETFAIETDYRRELEFAERARVLLSDLDGVVVPRVYRELSSERVLTLEYLEGSSFREFMDSQPTQEQRDLQLERIFTAVSRLFYSRLVWADAHPGNFRFLEDGRLGLLDFGCCRVPTDVEWDLFLEGARTIEARGAGWREVVRKGCRLSEEELADTDRFERAVALVDWLWEPIVHDGVFDFGDEEYFNRGMELTARAMRLQETRHEPGLTWSNRLFYGVRAIALQMRGRVNLKRIHDAELARAGIV